MFVYVRAFTLVGIHLLFFAVQIRSRLHLRFGFRPTSSFTLTCSFTSSSSLSFSLSVFVCVFDSVSHFGDFSHVVRRTSSRIRTCHGPTSTHPYPPRHTHIHTTHTRKFARAFAFVPCRTSAKHVTRAHVHGTRPTAQFEPASAT